MRKKTNKLIKTTARSLRRHQTDAEELLWKVIRNRKLANRKFLRQHPIEFEWNGQKRFFIADFFCHEAMLVIELDGKIHDLQKDRDAMREYVKSNPNGNYEAAVKAGVGAAMRLGKGRYNPQTIMVLTSLEKSVFEGYNYLIPC